MVTMLQLPLLRQRPQRMHPRLSVVVRVEAPEVVENPIAEAVVVLLQ